MFTDWLSTSEGLRDYSYLDIYERRLANNRTQKEIRAVRRMLPFEDQFTILDIPCGNGRHSLELARLGYRVYGVDINPELIRLAKEKGAAFNLNSCEFECADMRVWCMKNTFDVALSLYTGFGYFQKDSDDHQIIKNISMSLKNNGYLLIEYINSQKIIAQHVHGPKNTQVHTLSDRTNVETSSQITVDKKYFQVMHKHQKNTHRFSLRLYTLTELEKIVGAAGLNITNVYGGYDLSPLSLNSGCVILVCQKNT